MIVDCLVEPREPWNHDWTLSVHQCTHDRAYSGVRHGHPRALHEFAELLERKELHAASPLRTDGGRAMLHDKLLVEGQCVDARE
jgi:hypothetical protein